MTSALLSPPSVTARVPAKVNLELLVGPVRDDGFHTLSTVYQAVSLHDTVTVRPAQEWEVAVHGTFADGVPTTPDNLALRAATLLAEAADVAEPVHVTIRKEIPVAGGMAGGSADAAATLVACEHLWDLGMTKDALCDLAAELGSDVPFLLHGGTAVGSGRGEIVTPALARGTFHWVFVPSTGTGLSTPAVYGEHDRIVARRGLTPDPDPTPNPAMMSALLGGDAEALAAVLHNDLQDAAVALRPDLGDLIDAGMGFGALGGLVSGSGPTVAFLCADAEAAIDLAVSFTASGTATNVVRATGPVAGAQVVPTSRA